MKMESHKLRCDEWQGSYIALEQVAYVQRYSPGDPSLTALVLRLPLSYLATVPPSAVFAFCSFLLFVLCRTMSCSGVQSGS